MSNNKDIELMAHLMRRAGFGATREELDVRAAKGYEATVEELLAAGGGRSMGDDLVRRFHHELSGPDGRKKRRRALAIPSDNQQRASGREGRPLLAQHLSHRVPQGSPRQGAYRPDQNVPALRHGKLQDSAGGVVQGPGNDHLAGQPGEPPGRHQRELRQRAAGAVLHGCGQLHRAGH